MARVKNKKNKYLKYLSIIGILSAFIYLVIVLIAIFLLIVKVSQIKNNNYTIMAFEQEKVLKVIENNDFILRDYLIEGNNLPKTITAILFVGLAKICQVLLLLFIFIALYKLLLEFKKEIFNENNLKTINNTLYLISLLFIITIICYLILIIIPKINIISLNIVMVWIITFILGYLVRYLLRVGIKQNKK